MGVNSGLGISIICRYCDGLSLSRKPGVCQGLAEEATVADAEELNWEGTA